MSEERDPTRRLWSLIDNKDAIIQRWTRELAKDGPLAGLNLTARQRRIVALYRWEREVAALSVRTGSSREQQPVPVVGLDANGRLVVQRMERGTLRMHSLTRDGGPWDIKEPVHSLKDGRRITIPSHIHTIQER